MKKLCIMAFTIVLLAWTSVSQANILSESYDVNGITLDTQAGWSAQDSQWIISGAQTALPASASGAFTTDGDSDADPTVPFYYPMYNDTTLTWTGYQVLVSASKAITISNAAVYTAGWSISVLPTPGDATKWELDLSDATGKAGIVPGDELDFGYQMSFIGGITYAVTLSPMGTVAVPEPSTLVLTLSGLLGLAALRVSRRRRP